MNTVWIVLIVVAGAVTLACIVGVAWGKYQVKKASGQLRPLLTPRERAVYGASILLGVVFILVGIFYQPPAPTPDHEEDWMMSDRPGEGFGQDEQVWQDGEDFVQGEQEWQGSEDFDHLDGFEDSDGWGDESEGGEINYAPAYEDPADWEDEAPAAPPAQAVPPPMPRPAVPAPGGTVRVQ